MKRIICTCLALLTVGATMAQELFTGLLPEPQHVEMLPAGYTLTAESCIQLPENASPLLLQGVRLLQEELRRAGLPEPAEMTVPATATPVLRIGEGAALMERSELPKQGYDAYSLTITPGGIVAAAATDAGVFYALQTLRQLVRENGVFTGCRILDWADQRWRPAYGTFGAPKNPLPSDQIDMLTRMKVNMAIVESPWNGPQNWWYNPTGENLREAKEFIRLAQENNIEVVPLVQGGGWSYGVVDQNPACVEAIWVPEEMVELTGELTDMPQRNIVANETIPIRVTHADGTSPYREGVDYAIVPGVTERPFAADNAPWRIQILPGEALHVGERVALEYHYMEPATHQTPYCPAEPETYRILEETLRNVIAIYKPRVIHIGHDEIVYRNRCRRCRTSGKSETQLLGEDLAWWYATIKRLDPEITVMVWDDMLRAKEYDGALLQYLPEDVIICPWVYTADAAAQAEIAERLEWFIGRNQRKTIGTGSGYFHENALWWHDALAKYPDRPENLGFMFSFWGESNRIVGSLPMTAEFMWSAERPSRTAFLAIMQADYQLQQLGWWSTLPLEWQVEALKSCPVSPDEVDKQVEELSQKVNALRLPAFRDDANPFPEHLTSQMRRLARWYRTVKMEEIAK